MDRWKAEMGRVREEKRRRNLRRKKIQVREKVRKVAKHCVFPMICGSGGSKSRLAKADGAEPSGQMRDEKLHAVVARSTFRSQNVQNTELRSTFGSWDVEKVHAVVARSTFPSQSAKKTGGSDHFVVLRGRRKGLCTLSKVSKREGFVAFPKTMAGVGTCEEDLQRCIFRGRRSTRDMATLHYTTLH